MSWLAHPVGWDTGFVVVVTIVASTTFMVEGLEGGFLIITFLAYLNRRPMESWIRSVRSSFLKSKLSREDRPVRNMDEPCPEAAATYRIQYMDKLDRAADAFLRRVQNPEECIEVLTTAATQVTSNLSCPLMAPRWEGIPHQKDFTDLRVHECDLFRTDCLLALETIELHGAGYEAPQLIAALYSLSSHCGAERRIAFEICITRLLNESHEHRLAMNAIIADIHQQQSAARSAVLSSKSGREESQWLKTERRLAEQEEIAKSLLRRATRTARQYKEVSVTSQ